MTEELKPWWLSRTIWTGLATSIMAILTAAGWLPPAITTTLVEEVITGFLGLLTVYFRYKATAKVKSVTTVPTTNEAT